MIYYLSNVVTGKYAHWNTANNDYLAELYRHIEMIQEPERRILFNFAVDSSILVEKMVGPPKWGEERFLRRNVKTVSAAQFRLLHEVIISGFAGLFAKLNPRFGVSCLNTCLTLFEGRDYGKHAIDTILALEKVDAYKIGEIVSDSTMQILQEERNIQTTFGIAMLFVALYLESIKSLSQAESR